MAEPGVWRTPALAVLASCLVVGAGVLVPLGRETAVRAAATAPAGDRSRDLVQDAASPTPGGETDVPTSDLGTEPESAPDPAATAVPEAAPAGALALIDDPQPTPPVDPLANVAPLPEDWPSRESLDAQLAAIMNAAIPADQGNTGGTGDVAQPATGADVAGAVPPTGPATASNEVQRLVRAYFPADQLGNAMAVAWCESGHRNVPGAVNRNGTRDWGLFQLNDGGTLQSVLAAIGVQYASTADAQRLALDPTINVRAAASLHARRGWAPWACAARLRIVDGLWSSTPGPMDGHFDDTGAPRP